jgi:ribosomal protein S16
MISYSKKLLISYNKNYYLRLEKSKRFQYPFYNIVLTNARDGIIKIIGYYNPRANFYKLSYRKTKQYYKFKFKFLSINYKAIIFWFLKGLIPSISLFLILQYIGLFKNFSENNINYLKKIEKYHYVPELLEIINNKKYNVSKNNKFKYYTNL